MSLQLPCVVVLFPRGNRKQKDAPRNGGAWDQRADGQMLSIGVDCGMELC